MSDDLVKRLQANGLYECDEAIARIEELEAACWRMKEERDRAIGWRDSDKDRADAAEAKLAKAVEVLGFYATLIGEKHECPWHMLSDDFGEKARTTLAELTGGKDE